MAGFIQRQTFGYSGCDHLHHFAYKLHINYTSMKLVRKKKKLKKPEDRRMEDPVLWIVLQCAKGVKFKEGEG